MISGLLRPTTGEIAVYGRVNGLIALGAGFSPTLSGRENIFVNGAILGLSKSQISDRLDEIVEFAELAHAIDAPVRTYSSGMQVRLGFSAAVHLIRPDVLILDEVLAVGDVGFTVKCLNAMRELCASCATVFVTHSMQFVTLFCTHAALLSDGRTQLVSPQVNQVVEAYNSLFGVSASVISTGSNRIHSVGVSCRSNGPAASSHPIVPHGDPLAAEIEFTVEEDAYLRIAIRTQNLLPLIDAAVLQADSSRAFFPRGHHKVRVDLGVADFNLGVYPLIVGVFSTSSDKVLVRSEGAASIRIQKEHADYGFISRRFVVSHIQS
jgi:lipopolysaccharide transport system ATP-binding protein